MIRQKRVSFVVLLLLGTMPWLVSAAALPEFTRLVKQAAPTVVNITATRPADKRQQQYYNEEEVPELFRRFLAIYRARIMRRGHLRAPDLSSLQMVIS